MNQFINGAVQKYIKYSKRIAIFGVAQWAIIAIAALLMIAVSSYLNLLLDEWASRVINNVVNSSSALAIAICGGYYAHSAHDNALNARVDAALGYEEDETTESNG